MEAEQNAIDFLLNAANNTIPKCSLRLRKFSRPWWNEVCRGSRKRQKKLWNRFQKYNTTENFVAIKRAKALARRIPRRSQRESWISFMSTIKHSALNICVWVKAANRIYNEFSFPVLNTGITYSAPLDVANILGSAFV
ncbi:hypothetical protein AVEN_132178-1 [Araneus ventricosus]|uniref:Uncharacterized protein n=1 Tax=Araneus ventricosus TaxID=182803 RepID=A0A4Y2P310_ARAVE|nr:hypothetical protein AVEN_132178-1 [Araneus ventricosus]